MTTETTKAAAATDSKPAATASEAKNANTKTAAKKPAAKSAPVKKPAGVPAGTKHIADEMKAFPSRRVWPD
ncbi:hypothetical protein [Thiomicrorhabdus sediminis]|uniref:hypothetical protein n=1 Tax=Thiomicrorhabdus sediminis TaxID=2580412 RepID=UPI0019310404|nr:hypothetical protein [Thiomicrorhabdus sediminis]